jgi:hypothetical protein
MTRLADLHIHTHFSDSTSSPQEVIEQAHANGLSCIAITDHDTIDGIGPTIEEAKKYDIEVIPGIELSSDINGKDVHVLGYLIDHQNKEFKERLNHMQATRVDRMREMIGKLKALGIDNITLEEVCDLAQSDSVGRPHLAAKLIEKGWVNSIQIAFNKYLADDAPAFVPKFKQTPNEAIAMIQKAGGIAVLAHPMLTKVDELIPGFVKAGLGGIEVYYPNTTDVVMNFYAGLAHKHGLVVTGGSDAHGDAKKYTYIGKKTIPYELVEKLKNACHS